MGYRAAFKSRQDWIRQRLYAKREIDENGCWLWTGELSPGGYGRVSIDYKRRPVHQVILELEGIPFELITNEPDHTCNVRRCFNPEHLETVTRSENVLRSYDRRRATIGGEITSQH